MPPYKPTLEQEAILCHNPEQHGRVLAGPGTGKSATIVALIQKLATRDSAPRIKLLTFTRAATSELAKKVSEHPATATERPSTIHSFSISVLLRNPGTGDFPMPLRIADQWEEKKIVQPTLAHRVNVTVKKLEKLIREMAANWEYLQERLNPKVDPAERARFIGGWIEHRQIYGYTLLAELPYALRQALQDHADLEGVDYDLLIVDEYQDLNACDLELLHLIADRGCSIIGAGDDDQSIYRFRNADPEGIRRFERDYLGCALYPLSVTQRCGRSIIEWASYVIAGDLDRTPRPALKPAAGSPPGEVALLAFPGEVAEARSIATLIRQLIDQDRVPPEEILVLLRGDNNGTFSRPIKDELAKIEIPYSDPDAVERMLSEKSNRRMLETYRLMVHSRDSLAWASLLLLAPGIGETFTDYIYERARTDRLQFGQALFDAEQANFPGGPRTSELARKLMSSVTGWLKNHSVPPEPPESGWGHWMIEMSDGDIVPKPSADFAMLLEALDSLVEAGQDLGRYLGQILPLGKDRARAESSGVRIMTMTGSKGLTVRATIIAGVDDGIVPRPEEDLGEERRLLYVAMTRAKEFLFATWAGRRVGPTARAGRQRPVRERRRHTHFIDGGPVRSQDGQTYLLKRSRAQGD